MTDEGHPDLPQHPTTAVVPDRVARPHSFSTQVLESELENSICSLTHIPLPLMGWMGPETNIPDSRGFSLTNAYAPDKVGAVSRLEGEGVGRTGSPGCKARHQRTLQLFDPPGWFPEHPVVEAEKAGC